MRIALLILRDGIFKPSNWGMLGPGVYLATTLEKAINYAKDKDQFRGIVFIVEVNDMGNVIELGKNDPRMQTWHNNYDTAFSDEIGRASCRERV